MERGLKGSIFMRKNYRLCIQVQAKECALSVMPTFSCLGETRHLALAQEEFQDNRSCMSAHLLPLKDSALLLLQRYQKRENDFKEVGYTALL